MKRTKQAQAIVNSVNEYLRNNHIKTESDSVFVVMQHALIKANCYQGFNYFTAEGYLSGGDNEKFDHIELH